MRAINEYIKKVAYCISKRYQRKLDNDLKIWQVKKAFPSRNKQYAYFSHYFWHKCPSWVQEHRNYFSKENRGFGEDAFHALWFLLLRDTRPKFLFEIGVYRGQIISLWALISKQPNIPVEIHGISPFSPVGDSVSKYINDVDYYADTLANFRKFQLQEPYLHCGFSTEPSMVEVIKSRKWDCVYIDGNHDYDIVKQDLLNCYQFISNNGLIALDDSALYTDFKPPKFSLKDILVRH
jgi:hypothetical protein